MAADTESPDDTDDAIIEAYVERLLAVERDRERKPGPDHALDDQDLRDVARELGLSDEDLARVDRVVENHLTRGRNFFERGLFSEACAELHPATVLRPFDAALVAELARAHYHRFERAGDRAERERAQHFARRAIAIDPDHAPAYELLQLCEATTRQRAGRGARLALLIVALAVALAVALVSALVWWPRSPEQGADKRPSAATQDHAQDPPAGPAGSVPAGDSLHASSPETDVPMTLVAGADTNSDSGSDTGPDSRSDSGLALQVERSRLRRFNAESFSYTFHGTLSVSGSELRSARARLELLSPDGRVLRQKPVALYEQYKPRLRPGDATPVNVLIFEKNPAPAVTSARLVVEVIERAPAASRYDRGEPIALQWPGERPGERPAHIEVELNERSSEIKKVFDKTSHWLVLSITNTGQRPVEGLRVEVSVLAEDGAPLAQKLWYLVSSAGPSLPPGQTWVARTITDIATDAPAASQRFTRYKLRVVAAE